MQFRNIENMRVDNDLTQQKVANVLNCSRDVYRRYEKGLSEIPVWALLALADFYDVSTDYLLGRTEHKRSHKIPAPK